MTAIMTNERYYFPRHAGIFYTIAYRYIDGRKDKSSKAEEWSAVGRQRFWTLTSAMRVCTALTIAYNDGLWISQTTEPTGGKEL